MLPKEMSHSPPSPLDGGTIAEKIAILFVVKG